MAGRTVIILSIFTVTIQVNADFYDLFQNFQPYQQNYQTTRPDYSFFGDFSQNRPRTDGNRRNYDDTQTERPIYDNNRGSRERTTVKPKTKPTPVPIFNIESFTTPKSLRKNKNSSRRNNESSKPKNSAVPRRGVYDNPNDYYTEKTTRRNVATSGYSYTARPGNRHVDTNNDYTEKTTRRSLTTTGFNQGFGYTTRPGVRPAPVDTNKPPITNRPPTTAFAVYPRPTDSGAIRFPEDPDTSPEVMVGVDEDAMSAVEKRRFLSLAEKMCDKYKALNIKKVEAIPLLPSPEPVQLNVTVCPPSNVPLVVGGKVVSIEEFPHMALLGWSYLQKAGYSWKCGGSLISEQFVLTAGHCSYQEKDDTVVTGAPRVVQLGSSYMDDIGALVVKVAHVVRHPKYKRPSSYYDVALVKMVQAVSFSQVVKPACLGEPPGVGEPIIATGWGRTEFGGSQSLELRSVSVPIWDIEDCKEVLGVSRKMPNGPSRDSQICAGTKGKDTCQGDSGGPAQIQDGCAWRVVAVTSVGRSCGAPNTPALYATLHRAFIAAEVFGKTGSNQQTDRNDRPNSKPNRHNNQPTRPSNSNNQGNYYNSGSNENAGNTNNNRYDNSQSNTNTDAWNYNSQSSVINNGNKNNQNRNDNKPYNSNSNTNKNSPNYNTGSQSNTNYNPIINANENNNQNWNYNSQTNNNGNRNNNNQNWNSQTNENSNVNNNNKIWNQNSQSSTNNNGNTNTNYNDDRFSGLLSTIVNNKPQNNNNNGYNNKDINTNTQNNFDSYSSSIVNPDSIYFETNNRPFYSNDNREILGFQNAITTTKIPSYSGEWYNYGF